MVSLIYEVIREERDLLLLCMFYYRKHTSAKDEQR